MQSRPYGMVIEGMQVPVVNEREVRAAAGVLLLISLMSFMHAAYTMDFTPMRVVIVAFTLDFAIRVFGNPSYAPSMMLGRWATRTQEPEYTGAAQKRVAWALGLGIAIMMLITSVVMHTQGPINVIGCLLCTILLFSESALGICWGCVLYQRFKPDALQLCPGGSCAVHKPTAIQQITRPQLIVSGVFVGLVALFIWLQPMLTPAPRTDCVVPDFAIEMGHEEMWKVHNNCQ
ncbi:MAG: DUF4395 domain-containing protein [Roseiflexaceae bacterium]